MTLPVPLRVDELRVHGEEVVGLGVELAADPGELVGDVHVGPLHESLEHPAAVGTHAARAVAERPGADTGLEVDRRHDVE